jgi:hypothetical protein
MHGCYHKTFWQSRSSRVGREEGSLIFPFKQQREKSGFVCDEPTSIS